MKPQAKLMPGVIVLCIFALFTLLGIGANGWAAASTVDFAQPTLTRTAALFAHPLATPSTEDGRLYLPAILHQSTSTPTITPTPSPTPLSEFIESHPSCGGFPHESSPDWYWYGCVEGDIYEIQRINTSFTQAWYATFIGNNRKFTIEMDARLVQGAADYRVFFNNVWYRGFYAFGVNPVDGTFAVWRVDDEVTWVPLVDWTASSHIHRDDATNRLKVVRDEGQISVFVNNQYLTTVTDETYMGTSWGVYARNWVANSILHYFNMAIVYPRPPAPTPTPTRTPPPPFVVEIPCTQLPQFGEFPQGCVDNNSAYAIERNNWVTQNRAGIAEVFHPAPVPIVIPNFSVEGDAQLISGDGAYGLSFFAAGEATLFAVNPQDGTYVLWSNSGIPPAQMWTSSPHIKTDGTANRLKILHNPGMVSVYVNDQFLANMNISTVHDRQWGFFNMGSSDTGTVIFRNLKFTNLR